MRALLKAALVLAGVVAAVVLPTQFLPAAFAVGLSVALAAAPSARGWLLRFAALTLGFAGFFYGALGPASTSVHAGPLGLAGSDFATGLAAGARVVLMGAVATAGARWLPARELLPYATGRGPATYLVGSLVRLVPTLRADAQRLKEAQQARGHRFAAGPRAARAWVPLLTPLLVVSMRRAREQAIAIHLAGLAPDSGRRGPPGRRAHRWAVVAVLASLAILGRLALVGVPGVSLSFFFLFVAGVAYGPRVGLGVGLVERLATDLLLSGLNPIFLPLVLVDATLGAAAGLLGRWVNFGQRVQEPYPYAFVLAATAGAGMTIAFSLAADTATWTFFRWFLPGADPTASATLWTVLVVRGLLFNVPSAVFNAALFGAALQPALRALRESGALPASRWNRPPGGPSTPHVPPARPLDR